MGRFIDLTGERFGRLTVIERHSVRNNKIYWLCKCDCGNTNIASGSSLTNQYVSSCGCLRSEMVSNKNRTHNLSHIPEYKCYHRMMTRCYNTKIERYKNYGGRGIIVSDEWKNSFESFLSDMGRKPSPKHSLDRIDVNGNYCKENCRWATRTEQANNKTNSRIINYNGMSKTTAEWGMETGIKAGVIFYRLKNGWSVEDALTIAIDTIKDKSKKSSRTSQEG